MRTNLDTVLLRTFVAAARRESFAGAAVDVFRTQAAVSQQMQRLEESVGCKLFEQVGRRKQLTEHGVRLLDYARQILRLNDDACRALSGKAQEIPVRFGVCPDAVDTLLPDYLARSAKVFPGVRIEIVVGRSQWLLSALRRGAVDMFLDMIDVDDFPRHTLRTSPMVWIAGSHFQLQHGEALPLVLIDSPCVFREKAIEKLDEAGIAWRVAYTSTMLAGVRAALRAGLGVTPRSIEMLQQDLKVVGEDYGLPRLPNASFHLYRSDSEQTESVRSVTELFDSI